MCVQFLYSSSTNYTLHLYCLILQLGLTLDEGVNRARQNFLPLMKRNLLFWVPIQYAQFAFVPVDLQIPFLCLAGLIWTYILSALAGSANKYSNEVPENDEVYCITMTEDECVLPDDELIPIPVMFLSDELVASEKEETLSETNMIDDYINVGMPDFVELTKNNTQETLV